MKSDMLNEPPKLAARTDLAERLIAFMKGGKFSCTRMAKLLRIPIGTVGYILQARDVPLKHTASIAQFLEEFDDVNLKPRPALAARLERIMLKRNLTIARTAYLLRVPKSTIDFILRHNSIKSIPLKHVAKVYEFVEDFESFYGLDISKLPPPLEKAFP